MWKLNELHGVWQSFPAASRIKTPRARSYVLHAPHSARQPSCIGSPRPVPEPASNFLCIQFPVSCFHVILHLLPDSLSGFLLRLARPLGAGRVLRATVLARAFSSIGAMLRPRVCWRPGVASLCLGRRRPVSLYGPRARVLLRVHTRDMHSQPIAVHPFATVAALAPLEHARLPVRVLRAVVPTMLDNSAGCEALTTKFALSVLRRRRLHFLSAEFRTP